MVSALVPRESDHGLNPVWEHLQLLSITLSITPTVPLSTQVYKWVPVNLVLGVTL